MYSSSSTPMHRRVGNVVTPNSLSAAVTNLTEQFRSLQYHDEPPVAVNTSGSGSYSTDRSKERSSFSTPSINRHASFAKNDPFESPTKHKANSGNKLATPTTSRTLKHESNDNWRTRKSVLDIDIVERTTPPRQTPRFVAVSSKKFYTPAELNSGGQSAQALFPPNCCVFVANLCNKQSDENLEASLIDVFRDFGKVWVKVRRDDRQMPYAFAQYTNKDHAEEAIVEAVGRIVDGRPLRCEMAKANRIFLLQSRYGFVVNAEKIRSIFCQYGPIEECRDATPKELVTLDASSGVILAFHMYDHGQMAWNAHKHDHVYRMTATAHMGKNKVRGAYGFDRITTPQAKSYISSYDIERRSIFVGGLSTQTEDDLHNLFERFGPIVDITIHRKASEFNNDTIIWAFIEFKFERSTEDSILEMHGHKIFPDSGATTVLRVYQKDSKTSAARLTARNMGRSTIRAPQQQQLTPPTPTPTSGPAATEYLFGKRPSPPNFGVPVNQAQIVVPAPPMANPIGMYYNSPAMVAPVTTAPNPVGLQGVPAQLIPAEGGISPGYYWSPGHGYYYAVSPSAYYGMGYQSGPAFMGPHGHPAPSMASSMAPPMAHPMGVSYAGPIDVATPAASSPSHSGA